MNELGIYNKEVWCYCLLSEVCYNIDIGEYQTYGITVTSANCEHTIHDISVSEENVRQMVTLFNKYHLSPIHFEDVVEDMICDC